MGLFREYDIRGVVGTELTPALAEKIWKTIEEVRNSPAYRRLEREAADKTLR